LSRSGSEFFPKYAYPGTWHENFHKLTKTVTFTNLFHEIAPTASPSFSTFLNF
jgi:hypothetical protein